MLSGDDKRWKGLKSRYRLPFDPQPLLHQFESGTQVKATWHELWGSSIIKARWEMHPTLAFRILCGFIANAEFPTGIHTRSLPALGWRGGKGTIPSHPAGWRKIISIPSRSYRKSESQNSRQQGTCWDTRDPNDTCVEQGRLHLCETDFGVILKRN